MSGSCQQCHRRRPQLRVKRKGKWWHVCPNCAAVLMREEGVELEKAAATADDA